MKGGFFGISKREKKRRSKRKRRDGGVSEERGRLAIGKNQSGKTRM